jgi:hypothetical protein
MVVRATTRILVALLDGSPAGSADRAMRRERRVVLAARDAPTLHLSGRRVGIRLGSDRSVSFVDSTLEGLEV